MRQGVAVLAALAAAMLSTASCDSDSDGDEQAKEREPVTADDGEIARDAALTIDDLPAGWEERDSRRDPDAGRGIPECETLNEARDRLDPTGEVDSPNFFMGQAQAESRVVVYADDSEAREAFDAFAGEDVTGCLGATITEGIAGSEVTVEQEPLDANGDEGVRYVIVVTVVQEGAEQRAYSDVVGVRVGRALAELVFQDAARSLEGQDELITTVVDRLETADTA